ncbi:ARM repeat-containing protein [Pholiota conissans]|uniref:ARM repeat-containing protein n=1 Tax=Pholiota conissans TaxID=109636 RepID=A0A9P5YRH4_9AGAR|nr:ARM repeat-containing protein [Pholiota conissans]
MMEAVVPSEISTELTQILSNLVLGDNEIRSSAEKAVNERLAHTPELYLLALAQFAITADTEVMRSFSLVLLRRLIFRPAPNATSPSSSSTAPQAPSVLTAIPFISPSRTTLYDHLSAQTLSTLERLLLFSLAHETAPGVRRKTVDTVTDLAAQGMARGHAWHALQAQAFAMACAGLEGHPGVGVEQMQNQQQQTAPAVLQRESAFRVFAGCPNLVMDLQIDAVLAVFQRGLKDPASVEVRHAALLAAVNFLSSADPTQLAQSISLLSPMLDTLADLSSSLNQPPLGSGAEGGRKTSNYHYLSTFLGTLTPLCATHPILFAPHLTTLLSFLPGLILPPVDCGPTPTVSRPFPSSVRGGGGGGAFMFPPPGGASANDAGAENGDGEDETHDVDADEERDERSTLRLSALEFMISLSEARPNMVRKVPGWTEVVVRACLEGMGELDEDETLGLEGWLNEDPSTSSSSADTDSPPALYEQSLDRLACAMGGKSILPPAFQYIPSMMVSFDWRVRHAGLMAIAAIGEGTGKVMQKELQTIVDMVTPMFNDTHPRVRYASCQCVGQLCTDLEEIIQQRFHRQLFAVLIPALEDPEPRVHAHAASALINFCEGVERDTLLPYLDPIVERLLKLLNPPGDPALVRRYVQEQAITTLAMVADASEVTFAKHYGTIMPLLLSVLRNAEGPDYSKLRSKAMECAGLIAIAVGPDVFRPDSTTLIELLMHIQQGPVDPNDTQIGHYLMATWAKVCQALGGEFETYLPVVMPSLLATASAKADLSAYADEEDAYEEREGWETIVLDGRTFGVRTSAMDEKCQAFETLVIYCSTLGPRFAPYLAQTLEATLPSLRFYFHEGVREACAMLIPMLLACGKQSNTLTTNMVTTTFMQMIGCISTEHDPTFLASLYKYFTEALRVLGGPSALTPELHEGILEATKRQLHALAERRRARAARAANGGGVGVGGAEWDREELALVEEMEDFALEDMAKMLSVLDGNHALLVAVAGVRDLGFNTYDSDDDGEEEG